MKSTLACSRVLPLSVRSTGLRILFLAPTFPFGKRRALTDNEQLAPVCGRADANVSSEVDSRRPPLDFPRRSRSASPSQSREGQSRQFVDRLNFFCASWENSSELCVSDGRRRMHRYWERGIRKEPRHRSVRRLSQNGRKSGNANAFGAWYKTYINTRSLICIRIISVHDTYN